jgi:hypothetical protein
MIRGSRSKRVRTRRGDSDNPGDATMSQNDGRALLRHALATLAYRGAKTLAGAPAAFAEFRISPASRTPAQILAHLVDLLEWARSLAIGKQAWQNSPVLPWDEQVARFFDSLGMLDAVLAADAPIECTAEKLFQAPIADALTHIGQVAMLRRLAGSPVRGENYLEAEVSAGRVGPSQATPAFEFD